MCLVDCLFEGRSKVFRQRHYLIEKFTAILEDSPMVFQVTEHGLYGIRDKTRNFAPRPDAVARVRDLWLAK